MSKFRTVVLLGLAACVANVIVAAQAGAPSPQAARPRAPRAATAAPVRPLLVGSIKEIMDGIVDPTADLLFDAVSYDITAAGIQEKKPTTKKDWVEIRRHALLLAEVANLLAMPGRRVAPVRPVALELEPDDPAPTDLTPEQMQVLIDNDPAAFARLARGLNEAAVEALKAADAMDVDALFSSGDAIDKACESCHIKYWYPEDKQPAIDALTRRKK